MHLFITGGIGSGKSTIIKSILQRARRPVYGFVTQKGPESPLGSEIRMFPAGGGAGFPIAVCRSENEFFADVAALDEFGTSLLLNIPDGALVLMDELGFLESKAAAFREQVLNTLNRNVTVLGAIKPLPLSFLDAVRNHPNVRLVTVTPETRSQALSLAQELFFGPGGLQF